jgi:hypothetical protein
MARSLPSGSTSRRLDAWQRRIEKAPDVVSLRELYGGPGWAQVRQLESTAQLAGWRPRIYVASAGLGIRDVDALGPSYAATFSATSPDQVATGRDEQAKWWRGLSDLTGSQRLESVTGDAVLLVLSEAYAIAMAGDLVSFATGHVPTFVVGGAGDIRGLRRVPVERQLRRALGGTTTTLGLKTAIAWLDHASPHQLGSRAHDQAWRDWAARNATDDSYDRTKLSDGAVLDAIRRLVEATPGLSRTQALRVLRDQGFACEQRRFAQLFTTATAA